MITAAIDVGSNTLRLIIAEVKDKKIEKIIYDDRKITRLAEGLLKTGELSKKQIDATIYALKDFKKHIDIFCPDGSSKIKAIATSAVREAKNSELFINEAASIGLNIEVIDGKTEGFLTYTGVNAVINLQDESSLIFDIGGGSTEFIKTDKGNVKNIVSLPLGVVKIANLYNVNGIVSANIREKITLYINDILKSLGSDFNANLLIGTAGTVTTFAAMDLKMSSYDYKKINGYILKREKIELLIDELCALTAKERLNIKGLEAGREDLVIPGGLIIVEILKRFEKQALIVSDFGLREGAAIAASFN
jgi:exopolyphosphatase/guanosine-5'-triphosphate,3'-diphosphate pyrophosphatase